MTSHLLLNSGLYSEALIKPSQTADLLHIVTGYATPAMLGRLINELPTVKVNLIVGMVGHEGILLSDHEGFLKYQNTHPNRVAVRYTTMGKSVHTKLYVWHRGTVPVIGFAGSSNFSQNGFLIGGRRDRHSEILTTIDPAQGSAEFQRALTDTVSITDPNLSQMVRMKLRTTRVTQFVQPLNTQSAPDLTGAPSVVLPLVSSVNVSRTGTVKGEPHQSWGLNWGQRDGRNNKDEAVIPVPSSVWTTHPDFFPAGTAFNRPHFAVGTDDHDVMLMVVAEQNDKALHSVPSNAEIGQWFRRKLGVPASDKVTIAHLRAFGSRFVKVYRLDDETYHLRYDASVESEGMRQYGFSPM